MDYVFCGADWNCWKMWFWSSAAAAWFQAAFTMAAITVTIRLWRKGVARERHQTHLRMARNIVKLQTMGRAACACLGRLLDSTQRYGGYTKHQISITGGAIGDLQRQILDLSREELPNSGIINFSVVVWLQLSEVKAYVANIGKGPALDENKKEIVGEELFNVITRDLEMYQASVGEKLDKIEDFIRRYNSNPLARW